MTSPDRDQSEFNMAVSYLNRLNALFYLADEAAIGLDMYSWLHSLMALYRELSTEMTDSEITDFDDKFSNASNQVNSMISLNSRQGKNHIPQEVHKALHDLEIGIRRILKKAGLQSKMVDPAGAALK